MTQALFDQWPIATRRTYGWGAIGIVIATYFLSVGPIVLASIAIVASQIAGGADPDAAQAALEAWVNEWLIATILVQFALWGVMIWAWARLFERRRSPTFGIRYSAAFPLRYAVGLVLGVLLVIAIGQVGLLLGAEIPTDEAPDALALSRLVEPGLLGLFAFVVFVFLIQGGAEEVIFRGWLMSTLAARWGVRAGVIISSLAFMLFHAHVFISGLAFGVVALTGLGAMGLVFALLSLVTRSIVEAVAAHGAFNAAAVTAPVAVMLAQDPDLTPAEAFAEVFAAATGTAGPDGVAISAKLFAQGLTAGAISVVLLLVLLGRRRSPVWQVEPSADG